MTGGFATTVTVRNSRVSQLPNGATALILDTVEAGAIGFLVNLQMIALLRAELDKAETLLRPASGNA